MSIKIAHQHLLLTLFLLLQAPLALSDASLGLDHYSGDLRVGERAELNSTGPGISFGWSFSDNWAINVSRSEYDGDAVVFGEILQIRYDINSDTTTSGASLSYFGENTWVSLGYNTTEDRQDVIASSNDARGLVLSETLDTDTLTLDLGYEWTLGNWSPSLSAHVSVTDSEVRLSRPLAADEEFFRDFRDEISGTDFGASVSTVYYFELSQSALLAPQLGIFYQQNIEGENNSSVVLRQGNRVVRTSDGFRGSIGDDEQISGNLGISLLTGDWIWSLGYIADLGSNETGDSWFAGLNYLF